MEKRRNIYFIVVLLLYRQHCSSEAIAAYIYNYYSLFLLLFISGRLVREWQLENCSSNPWQSLSTLHYIHPVGRFPKGFSKANKKERNKKEQLLYAWISLIYSQVGFFSFLFYFIQRETECMLHYRHYHRVCILDEAVSWWISSSSSLMYYYII